MTTPLNILIVEDSQNDAELALQELRRAGFDPKWRRVETEQGFLDELPNRPDIILSDYSMPQFSGLRAAKLLRESGLKIPFILISGTVGEEVAVEAMKFGATDYLLKDRLTRLGQAVGKALEQKHFQEEYLQTQRELLSKTAMLDAMLDNIPAFIYFKDLQSRFVLVSRSWADLFQISDPEKIKGKADSDFFPPKHAQITLEDEQRIIRTGQPMVDKQELVVYQNGDKSWGLTTKLPWRDATGAIIGTFGISRDITAIKKAEEKLAYERQLLRTSIDLLPDVFYVKDLESRFLMANEALAKSFGKNHYSELIGLSDADFFPPEMASAMRAEEKKIFSGEPVIDHEDDVVFPDGRKYTLLTTKVPFRDSQGRICGLVGIGRDITERKQLEEQLRQTQKMESIGQLAGGVAHDFNNILGVIQMQADLMKIGCERFPAQAEFADEISAAAQRAAALTRQLLLFSRKETMHQQDLDLNESINNMAKMLRRTLGENIQVQFRFAMQALHVRADAGMMDQVLMNLAVNSRDAMPKGGKLIIETSAAEFDEQAASQSAQMRAGSFVCLGVSDTGCGIPPENLARIFEPFFTTKEVGKGTGLGLATVFGIVQQHQGWINIYSEVGRGTTFRIYLPRLKEVSGKKAETAPAASLPRGQETILLVEDDAFVRNAIRRTLSGLGYHVLEATNGAEALEVWKLNRDKVHLVLTDMVMPGGMTGKDLGERLVKDNPGLKVIYMSGYTAEFAGKDFPLEEGVDFLTKPFSSPKLAQTIRARLDR